MLIDVVFQDFSDNFLMRFLCISMLISEGLVMNARTSGDCEIAVLYVNNNVLYGFSKFMISRSYIKTQDVRNRFRVEN